MDSKAAPFYARRWLRRHSMGRSTSWLMRYAIVDCSRGTFMAQNRSSGQRIEIIFVLCAAINNGKPMCWAGVADKVFNAHCSLLLRILYVATSESFHSILVVSFRGAHRTRSATTNRCRDTLWRIEIVVLRPPSGTENSLTMACNGTYSECSWMASDRLHGPTAVSFAYGL